MEECYKLFDYREHKHSWTLLNSLLVLWFFPKQLTGLEVLLGHDDTERWLATRVLMQDYQVPLNNTSMLYTILGVLFGLNDTAVSRIRQIYSKVMDDFSCRLPSPCCGEWRVGNYGPYTWMWDLRIYAGSSFTTWCEFSLLLSGKDWIQWRTSAT